MQCQLWLIYFVSFAYYKPDFKAFFTIIKYDFYLVKAVSYARAQAVLQPFFALAHTNKRV